MPAQKPRLFVFAAISLITILAGAPLAFGSSIQGAGQQQSPQRTYAPGAKTKMKGVIVRRDVDTITVRDAQGYESIVRLTDATEVKSKGGFFRRGTSFAVTSLLRGLIIEAEGRGNAQGELVAEKIRFSGDDMKVAQSVEAGVAPVEGRVGEVEGRVTAVERQNEVLSGQIDELDALSKMANEEAKRANEGVLAANTRISAIDDYDVQNVVTVYFKVNSAVLSPEGKASLDEIAAQAVTMRGFLIEIAGFTDSTGSIEKNRALSQRRADSVVRYLTEQHDIPLRRLITPYGYGELKAVADNDTLEGRQQNRRVEVKLLVSRGLTDSSGSTPQ